MKRLRVSNLTIQYPTVNEPAVENIHFELAPGDSLLLAGASGSGKSTLALALAGLIPRAVEAVMQGDVFLDDVNLASLRPGLSCQQVGIVFQDPEAQFCMLTVEEEIAFGLENVGMPTDQMKGRIRKALLAVGLENYRTTRIDRLSGGLKQKLALACILSQQPSIIVLDEPTANLDPVATRDFFRLVAKLKASGKQSIVLIEHKLEVPALFMDKTMVLERGRIVEYASTRQVFASHGARLKELGVWQPYASELAQALESQGVALRPFPLTVDELCQAAQERSHVGPLLIREIKSQVKSCPKRLSESMVRLDDVSFAYRHGTQTTQVFDGVSWEIIRGSFTALVGQNGAGKSTLARMILGLLQPSQGRVLLNNEPVERIHRKRLTQLAGLVFQNPEHQFITDTVWDEVAFALQLAGKCEKEVAHTVESLLTEFQLDHRADANPFSLSQGEKRRLSVAAMLSTGQQLLLLDELSFGQDYTNTYRLMNLVLERQRQGCTVLIITHDMRLVLEYATDVGVLHQGKLAFTGKPTELFQNTLTLESWSLSTPPGIQVIRGLEVS